MGAGTFKPVKAAVMEQHEMHAEWIDVSVDAIQNIINNLNNTVVAVGTTSLAYFRKFVLAGAKLPGSHRSDTLQLNQWKYMKPGANKLYRRRSAAGFSAMAAKNNYTNCLHKQKYWLRRATSLK